MWSFLDGVGRALGLLARAIQTAWDAWRARERQRSADSIAADPAGEWLRRFNPDDSEAAKTDPGEPGGDS
ncbi:hypothetical protein [Oceanidesulfovibrio indonesiensis]|uniref:hypothetical protein n=1 Tax=Oceanidesulfovibrio indonesiensis TaxID=54767 RepID=UPI001185FA0A|nr:hypothetical protein [Oceanidesulfovibrio indonesiensis]